MAALALAGSAQAAGPGEGLRTGGASQIGGCTAESWAIYWTLDTAQDRPVALASLSWRGEGGCLLSLAARIRLELTDGQRTAYIEFGAPRPQPIGDNSLGRAEITNADWDHLLRDSRTNVWLTAAEAKALWRTGRVSSASVVATPLATDSVDTARIAKAPGAPSGAAPVTAPPAVSDHAKADAAGADPSLSRNPDPADHADAQLNRESAQYAGRARSRDAEDDAAYRASLENFRQRQAAYEAAQQRYQAELAAVAAAKRAADDAYASAMARWRARSVACQAGRTEFCSPEPAPVYPGN